MHGPLKSDEATSSSASMLDTPLRWILIRCFLRNWRVFFGVILLSAARISMPLSSTTPEVFAPSQVILASLKLASTFDFATNFRLFHFFWMSCSDSTSLICVDSSLVQFNFLDFQFLCLLDYVDSLNINLYKWDKHGRRVRFPYAEAIK